MGRLLIIQLRAKASNRSDQSATQLRIYTKHAIGRRLYAHNLHQRSSSKITKILTSKILSPAQKFQVFTLTDPCQCPQHYPERNPKHA
jgi:hypothetical protein